MVISISRRETEAAQGIPMGNGQNRKTMLAKMLRIDVNSTEFMVFRQIIHLQKILPIYPRYGHLVFVILAMELDRLNGDMWDWLMLDRIFGKKSITPQHLPKEVKITDGVGRRTCGLWPEWLSGRKVILFFHRKLQAQYQRGRLLDYRRLCLPGFWMLLPLRWLYLWWLLQWLDLAIHKYAGGKTVLPTGWFINSVKINSHLLVKMHKVNCICVHWQKAVFTNYLIHAGLMSVLLLEDPDCDDLANGWILLSSNQKNCNYEYRWDNGISGMGLSGLPVVLSRSLSYPGCEVKKEINLKPKLRKDNSPGSHLCLFQEICDGDSAIIVACEKSGKRIKWYNNGIEETSLQGARIFVSKSGLYSIRWEDTTYKGLYIISLRSRKNNGSSLRHHTNVDGQRWYFEDRQRLDFMCGTRTARLLLVQRHLFCCKNSILPGTSCIDSK